MITTVVDNVLYMVDVDTVEQPLGNSKRTAWGRIMLDGEGYVFAPIEGTVFSQKAVEHILWRLEKYNAIKLPVKL